MSAPKTPQQLADEIRDAQETIRVNCAALKAMGAAIGVRAADIRRENVIERYDPVYCEYRWFITMPAKTVEIEPEREL